MNESQYGILMQTPGGIEDGIDSDGRADIDRFSDFMRELAPPPTLPQNSSAQNGARLFSTGRVCGMPCGITNDRSKSRIVHSAFNRRNADKLQSQPDLGESDVPSVLGLFAA